MARMRTSMDSTIISHAPSETTSAATMRLLQLVSPSLPIGSFTYSQGLEWAVETGWVQSQNDLQAWLKDILRSSVTHLEIPLFFRLHRAYQQGKLEDAAYWIAYLLASRETSELQIEEQQRGRAFARLIPELGLNLDTQTTQQLCQTQLAGFAYAVVHWNIDPLSAIQAYTWSWLENLSLAGVKLIPLGQTAGQQIIFELGAFVATAVEHGRTLNDKELGFSCCAQAIASSLHEQQYTRLYRS